MFTYEQCLEACKRLGLNPLKRGQNPFADSKVQGNFEDPFDLRTIGFPEESVSLILGIGALINNLVSQKKFTKTFNLTTKNGKLEKNKEDCIEVIMPILITSQQFWLEQGFASIDKKVLKDLKLNFHHGILYQRDPAASQKFKVKPNMVGTRPRLRTDLGRRVYR